MSVLIEREIENDFNKYNWIDVKEYARQIFAEGIFNDITYEIYWAEDMWNILMFESVIDITNIIKAELSDYKIDNWEEYISKYLYDLIYKELNLEIVEGELNEVEFYDIKNDNFNYEYDSVAYKVLENEIMLRRNLVIQKIKKYFFSDYNILEFMAGEHCCEHYYRLEEKIQKLYQKYEKQISLIDQEIRKTNDSEKKSVLYDKRHDIEWEYEKELQDVRNKAPISLLGIEEVTRLGDVTLTYNWIYEGMQRLDYL